MTETGGRECIFCGGTPVTKEHVFGDSMREYVTAGRVESVDLRTGMKVSDIPSPFDVTIKRVCAPCNNGWMNRLDQLVRAPLVEMVNGSPTVLDPETLSGIAGAMGKIALLRGYVQVSRPPTTADDRRVFYETHRPPLRWRMWIGHIDHVLFQDRHRRSGWAIADRNDTEARFAELRDHPLDDRLEYAFSYLLGMDRLLVLTVGVSSDHSLQQHLSNMYETFIAHHQIPLISIWPDSPQAPITWPPSTPVTTTQIQELDALLDGLMDGLREAGVVPPD